MSTAKPKADISSAGAVADQIASWIYHNDLGIGLNVRTEVLKNAKGNAYYRVPFRLPTLVDGEVNIYNTGWALVWFATSLEGVSGEHHASFKGKGAVVDGVLKLLTAVAIKKNPATVAALLAK